MLKNQIQGVSDPTNGENSYLIQRFIEGLLDTHEFYRIDSVFQEIACSQTFYNQQKLQGGERTCREVERSPCSVIL